MSYRGRKSRTYRDTGLPFPKRAILNEIDIRMHQAGIEVPWAADNVYLVGSRAKGKYHEDSDVDIAVVLPKGSWTDEDQAKLDSVQEEEYLEGVEGVSEDSIEFDVHLISKDMLSKPYIKI